MRADLNATGPFIGLNAMLDTADGMIPPEAKKIVAKGALNIKNDARSRIKGLAHAPAYPYSITYDPLDLPRGPAADVGPDKSRRQGALGNILEYGSSNNPAHPHMAPAVEAEAPRLEQAAADLAEKALS